MNFWYLLLGALPLIIYALIEWRWGLKAGVVAAIFIGILEFLFTYYYLGIFDPTIMFALILLACLGSVSIFSKKPIYFLLQPSFLGFGMAGILIYFQYWDTPLILKYMDRMEHIPEFRQALETMTAPGMRELMIQISEVLIYVCLIHAVLMVIVAFKCNRVIWLLVRVPGFWIMLIGSVMLRIYLSRDSIGPLR